MTTKTFVGRGFLLFGFTFFGFYFYKNINQIINFADVIRGETAALVTGLDGLKTLLVIEAIQKAAQTQSLIEVVNPSKISTNGVAAQ